MNDLETFHHVALSVRDLDVSVAWYADVLGFKELFREENPERRACVMQFAGGGFSVGLTQHGATGTDTFDPTRLGLDHLGFSVSSEEDMAEWAARLTAASVEHSGAIPIPPGAILNFKDPDGLALCLFWERS